MVKSWVNLLNWLLIGCSLLSSLSGASQLVDTTLDKDYNSRISIPVEWGAGGGHTAPPQSALRPPLVRGQAVHFVHVVRAPASSNGPENIKRSLCTVYL